MRLRYRPELQRALFKAEIIPALVCFNSFSQMYSGCASQRPLSHLSGPSHGEHGKRMKNVFTVRAPWNIYMIISLICILVLSKVIWRKDDKRKEYLNQWSRRPLSFVIWSRKRARRAEYAPTCEYFGPFTTHLGFIQSNMSLIKSLLELQWNHFKKPLVVFSLQIWRLWWNISSLSLKIKFMFKPTVSKNAP